MAAFLPQIVFRWFTPAGTPAFNYTAAFYGAGLSPIPGNLKTIYGETDGATPIANPQTFDVEGKISVTLGAGAYKVVIRNTLGATVYTKDNVPGEGGFGSGFVSSIADLKNVTSFDPAFIYVAGYYTPGDGGHGMFRWDGGDATADDGGYTIAPASNPVTGRWKRIPDEDGYVRPASFGFDQGTSSILTTQMQAADTYAATNGRPLLIDVGTGTAQVGTMTFSAPKVIFTGRGLKATAAATTWTFDGLVEASPTMIFQRGAGQVYYPAAGTQLRVNLNHPAQRVHPEWWSAARDGMSDDLDNINGMFASGAPEFVFSAGDYEVSATPTFPATGRLMAFGTVTEGGTTHVPVGIRQIDSAGEIRSDKLKADSTINAGTSVTAGANVDAGTYAKSQAGAGGLRFKSGGVLDVSTATVGNVGAGEDDLYTFSIPENTLNVNKDKLEFELHGLFANNANVKRLRLYFGGTLFFDTGASYGPQAVNWRIVGSIYRASSSLANCVAVLTSGTIESVTDIDMVQRAEIAVNMASGTKDFKLTGEATANDDIQTKGATLKFFPTP